MSPSEPSIDVAANLTGVKSAMADARKQAGLDASRPTVVAVAKKHGLARIRAGLAAGHRCFGENRVEEAAEKWPALKGEYPELELHMVGQLQSRKAEDAVALFDVIQSLDRPKLARRLAKAMAERGRRPRLFIQVDTGDEPQKGGVSLDDLPALLALARDELALPVDGLMVLPPAGDDPALHFALLAKLARRHGLAKLSMGMSGDYAVAAAMGADYVRIGEAVFGPRPAE